jgi:hypothetical protein
VLTLNEACELVGALPIRETELSSAAYRVYCTRFNIKPSRIGTKRSWLGMVRLPDRTVSGGKTVPAEQRSVKWPGVYKEKEILDPSDKNGLTTIITRTMKGLFLNPWKLRGLNPHLHGSCTCGHKALNPRP